MKYKGFTAAVSWVCIYRCSWLEGLIKIMGFFTSLPLSLLLSGRWKCNKLDWSMSLLCAGSQRSSQIWWERGGGFASEDKANGFRLALWIWMSGSPFPPLCPPFPFPCSQPLHFPANQCVTTPAGLVEEESLQCSCETRKSWGTTMGGPFPDSAQMHSEVGFIWLGWTGCQTEARRSESALNLLCRVFSSLSCSGEGLVRSKTGPSSSSHGPFPQKGQEEGLGNPLCLCRAWQDIPWLP